MCTVGCALAQYGENRTGDYVGERLYTVLKSMEKYNIWTNGMLCLGSPGSASGSVCAIMVSRNNYYLFDPHSRDISGRPVEKGTSVLLHFRTAGQCCTHIYNLAQTLICSQFKITFLKVEPLWLSIYVEDRKSKQYRKAKESSVQLSVKQLAKDKELSEEEKIAMKKKTLPLYEGETKRNCI